MSTLTGTELSDTTLVGSLGDDTIYGLGGDDVITTGTGNDIINAGAGKDILVVDYSLSTTKVTMSAPTDTGVVLAGTGFPAPGGTDYSGVYNDDHTTFTASYSNLDLGQADQIWLGVGGSGLPLSGISDDGKTATVTGSYTYSSYTITYSIAATVSEGVWAQPTDVGIADASAVHQLGSDSLTVTYAIDIVIPPELASVAEFIKAQGYMLLQEQLRGNFYYDDAGTSGSISDGTSNTVTFDDVENFVITTGAAGSDITTGDGNDRLTGGIGDDHFNAAGGDDVMIAGGGSNVMNGGAGSDTVDYWSIGQALTVTLTAATTASVFINGAAADIIVNVENVIGGSDDDRMAGDDQDNRFVGNGGNDVFVASLGHDTLSGNAGTDTVDYSGASGAVSVTLEGDTFVAVSVGGVAKDNISGIENIIGGNSDDQVTGDALDNVFMGGLGADSFFGGGGSDTADFSDKTGAVQVTLKGAAAAIVKVDGSDEDILSNVENVIGGSNDDRMAGDDQDNRFDGNAGNDIFVASLGHDTLSGYAGTDTVDYSGASGAVSVTLDGDTFVAVSVGGVAKDSVSGIENIIGGNSDDQVTGDALDNIFKGGLGADTFDGGGGSDTADFSDKTGAVQVTLNGATAVSVKVGGAIEDTLSNVENVWGGSGNDQLIGDGASNMLLGIAGNDLLQGGFGIDVLDGGAGNDTADYSDRALSVSVTLKKSLDASVKIGGLAEDIVRNVENIVSGSKADVLIGDGLANRLGSGDGNDKLNGAGGNDVLTGGGGKDALAGGGGHDTFIFLTAADSVGKQHDTIADFSRKQKDEIDLSAIDAKEATGADDAFHFLSAEGAKFQHAGDLQWVFKGTGSSATTWVEGDTDGDHKADFSILLHGHIKLAESCFDL